MSYFTWTEESTLELIGLRKSFDNMFTGKRGCAKLGWETIAQIIQNKAPGPVCKKKWENMLKKYKELKMPRTGVSTEDGEDTPVTWPYFNQMDSWLSEKHFMKPLLLIDSTSMDIDNSQCAVTTDKPNYKVLNQQKDNLEQSQSPIALSSESEGETPRSVRKQKQCDTQKILLEHLKKEEEYSERMLTLMEKIADKLCKR